MAGRHGARRFLQVLLVLTLTSCSAVTSRGSVDRDTLTLLLSDDWATAPAVADVITDFEEAHGVRVEVRGVQFGQIEEFLLADRSGSREIDAAQWHAFAAGALGLARPVTDRFRDRYPEGTFVPGAIEDVSWAGQIHGVPLDVNAVVMIVNTDLLTRVGHTVEDLRTWAGVRRVAGASGARGVRFTHVAASTWSTYAWVRANGGRWLAFGAGDSPRPRFDTPAVVETFAFLSELVADDLAYAAEDVDTASDAAPLFADQQTLALTSGTWDVVRLEEHDPGFAWTVVPMPSGPHSEQSATVLGGSSLFVTEQAEDADRAWELITTLIQPEPAMRYAREDGRLPARTDVLADPFFDQPSLQVAVDELPRASAMRMLAFPRLMDRATRRIYEVLHGQGGAADVFPALQAEAPDLMNANGRATR